MRLFATLIDCGFSVLNNLSMSTYFYRSLIYIRENKFAFLLFGLIQHLYIGMTGISHQVYESYMWPITMVVLGVCSIGVFNRTKLWAKAIGYILLFGVMGTSVVFPVFGYSVAVVQTISLMYMAYFLYIAWGIRDCLFRPRTMSNDIIWASASGYFLLIEITVFWLMFFYAGDPTAIMGIDASAIPNVYMDMVYFATISQSTVGYGDISPVLPAARLTAAFMAAVGQLYIVLLVGVLISRYAGRR